MMRTLCARAVIGSATVLVGCLFLAGSLLAEELKCRGPFARDTSHQRLVATFGQSNVGQQILHEEGAQFKASIVFPGDSARRVEVIWHEEKELRRPSNVQTQGASWSGPAGIRVGTPLDQVEAINGRPFILSGFGWDYGGTASDWKGGTLAKLLGGCNLIVVFEDDESAEESAIVKAQGDGDFGSDSPEIRAVRPKVKRIGFAFPQ